MTFEGLPAGQFRHRDHRFEWTRAEFEAWAGRVAERHGYTRALRADRRRGSRARRADADGGVHADERSTDPGALARRPDRRRPAPASRRSRGSTSSRPRSSRRTSAAAWSPTTRTTRPRPTTRSRCCTSSPASGWRAGRLTVVDATNVQPEARKPLVELAREYHVLPVAIVFDLPERLCQERNREPARPRLRPARHPQPAASSCGGRCADSSRRASATCTCSRPRRRSTRRRSSASRCGTNRRAEHGPFDIIGDVHGCFDELVGAAATSSATTSRTTATRSGVTPSGGPQGGLRRRPRRPRAATSRHVLRLVMAMVDARRRRCACPATTT